MESQGNVSRLAKLQVGSIYKKALRFILGPHGFSFSLFCYFCCSKLNWIALLAWVLNNQVQSPILGWSRIFIHANTMFLNFLSLSPFGVFLHFFTIHFGCTLYLVIGLNSIFERVLKFIATFLASAYSHANVAKLSKEKKKPTTMTAKKKKKRKKN